jgi:hypothetical protein
MQLISFLVQNFYNKEVANKSETFGKAKCLDPQLQQILIVEDLVSYFTLTSPVKDTLLVILCNVNKLLSFL